MSDGNAKQAPEWPRFQPDIAPYFEAAAQQKLLVKRCADCGKMHHYPRAHCPHCFSDNTEWFECAGSGSVYSYTVLRGRAADKVIAYVELDEGPRLLSNIVDCQPEAVAIGIKVAVTFREQADGTTIPFFTLQQD